MTTKWEILEGNALAVLPSLPAGHFHTAVTSPPYFNLRSYLKAGDPLKPLEIGSERTPAEYVEKIVAAAREVRRVLHDSGTFWLNVGDSYAGGGGGNYGNGKSVKSQGGQQPTNVKNRGDWLDAAALKPKDLCLIPQRLVLALQDDGWYVRSVIRWFKVSPMPEPVRDRPTSAVEEIFLLAKSERYFYDADAERVPHSSVNETPDWHDRTYRERGMPGELNGAGGYKRGAPNQPCGNHPLGRNLWNWWAVDEEGSGSWFIANEPLKEAHYAAFPSELARRCIRLGTSEHGCCPKCAAPWRRVVERSAVKRKRPNEFVKRTGEDGTGNVCGNTVAGVAVETKGWEPTCRCGVAEVVPCRVLDPFAGAGTTLLEALRLGRHAIGVELNPVYAAMARKRVVGDCPLFNS